MRNPAGFQFYPGRRLPVVCRDGVTRSAVCTGYAGHGLPAAVQVYAGGKRRTVSGTIYPLPFSNLLSFYATGRNSDLIGWTAHKPRLAAAARRLLGALTFSRGYKSGAAIPLRTFSETLATSCRLYLKGVKHEGLGFLTCAMLRRLPTDLLPRLAAFFERLALFQAMELPPRPSTPPPPPPVV